MTSASPLPAPSLVLAGFIPHDLHRLTRALALPDGAFEKDDSFLFRLYREYYRLHRGMLPIQAIGKRLSTEPADVTSRVAAHFRRLHETEVEDHLFEWALASTFDNWRDSQARSVLLRASQIMTTGAVEGEGDKARAVYGYEEMRATISKGFQRIDRALTGSTPEIELAESYDKIIDLNASAQTDAKPHFPTGIDVLDSALPHGGPATGQFWFVAAFAGTGKTTFSISVLTYQAIMHGLNVVYLSGETLIDECQVKLVARHSRAPQFGLPYGIDTLAVPQGLPDDQREVYAAAARDLTENSGRDYGHVLFRQMPMRNNVEDVLDTLERVEARWPVHVLVVDSIDMVRISAEMARGAVSYREQLSQTIEDFANLSVSYQNGRGLLVVSPYQINRAGYDRAMERSGRYELNDLSETAMAERRASVVLSLLRLPDAPTQIRTQILKNRHGPTRDFPLDFDPRSAYIGSAAGVVTATSNLDF